MRVALSAVLLVLFLFAPLVSAQESFDSGSPDSEDYMEPGDTFSFTFNEVHEEGYTYHCHPHPWMSAMVHVYPEGELASMEPGTHTIYVDIIEGENTEDWGYLPEHLSIEVGDTVVWNNTGDFPHTVTSEAGDHHHDHDDTASDDDETEGTPTPSLLLVLAAMGAVAALRRRP